MKILCKQEKLIKALNIVSRAVSPTSTLGITKGILIKTDGDMQVSLSATDIQMAITTQTDAIVNEHGGVVVSARLFTDLVRKLPGGDILIATDEKHVVSLKTEHSDYELQGKEEDEFPRIDADEEGRQIRMEKDVLRDFIDGTCFSASADESRGVITGVLFEIMEGVLSFVALDGYRVAIRRGRGEAFSFAGKEASEDLKAVIPARLLREVGKILSDTAGGDDEALLDIGQRRVKLSLDGTLVRVNLLEGDFIKYREVIPAGSPISVKLERAELLSAVERAAMLRSEGGKNSFVRFSLADGALTVSSRADEGRGRETVACEKKGEDLEIGFDARFVTDVLKAVSDERISLEFNTSVSPCLVRPLDGDGFEYLVLPVRLSTVSV